MTKEEFKKKFKVGDKLWHPKIKKGLYDYILLISHEGNADCVFTGVCVKDGKKIEEISGSKALEGLNWQHYKEPVKNDLEWLNRYYCVNYRYKKIESVVLVYADSKFENVYWDDELISEYITEEEAIERGLKI